MKERILKFIKAKGISQNTFEERSGLSCGTVTNMAKGMRTDKFADVLRAFPDLNAYWLLGIEPDMLRTAPKTPVEPPKEVKLCQPLDCTQTARYEAEINKLKHELELMKKESDYWVMLNEQRNKELDFLRSEILHKNQMLEYFSKQN